MKDQLKKIRYKLENVFSKNQAFVVACLFLAVVSLVVYRLIILSNIQPDQSVIDDQTISIKATQFNQDEIDKIEALRDSNVKNPGIQLQKNRQNPFAE